MLAPDTKRHIDAARQVLVGKVPDPKSQIEQITNALVYKFMDDMDGQAAALGGKRRYFIGDYEKYGWRLLMNKGLGAHERLILYREALEGMSKNRNIPELFRSIFRNAYLPFNDARTLTLFLTEIDYFSYDNSEELGNGYEYLLSIMGSQGDAGQFRTPRHIIDFIVDAVDPTKNDSVLDPACGTAGFLISAYKHVMAKHDGKDDITGVLEQNEIPLTADERHKIYQSYHGFDIDDNMVKMAKVNMYLHGFPDPRIIVHDSLSSEDYWNDRYDVILANPPFMSPKGGIEPHQKFGIHANRSEVLFVDYIASHLKPTGRAGVIVPEGIIFQGGKAYRELRKNLVDNYLYAVVSLPAGVFQPYSGVKTSILLMDKELASKNDKVMFVKIENDGLSLGAQRREISGNQFPQAVELIKDFQNGKEVNPGFVHVVSRQQIAETAEYNLSGDRYIEIETNQNQKWPTEAIGEIVETITAKVKIKSSEVKNSGKVPVIDQSQKYIAGYTDNNSALIENDEAVAFGDHTRAVKYIDFGFAQGADGIKILRPKNTDLLAKFLYFVLRNLEIPNKGYSRHWTEVKRMKIPIPPLEVQHEIVVRLDSYQKIIDAAQSILKNYKPEMNVNPTWPSKPIEEVALFQEGPGIRSYEYDSSPDAYPIINVRCVKDGYIDLSDGRSVKKQLAEGQWKHFQILENDILFTISGTIGRSAIVKQSDLPLLMNTSVIRFRTLDEKILMNKFLYAYLNTPTFIATLKAMSTGAAQQNVGPSHIKQISIVVPPLEEQKRIVAELESEQKIIDANKRIIEIYKQKIKFKIAEVWGE